MIASASVGIANEASAVAPTPFIYQFGTNHTEGVGGVGVSSCGNVYVGGSTNGKLGGKKNAGQSDGYLVKLSRSGSPTWTRVFGTVGREHVSGVAISPCGGSIYVVGYTDGEFPNQTNAGGTDIFVAKYSSGGTKLWVKQYGTTGDDWARGIAISPSGFLYVTGSTTGAFPSFGNAGGTDGFLIKLSSGGTVKWAEQAGTVGDDQFAAVAVNKNGTKIYVTGETTGSLPPYVNQGDVDSIVVGVDNNGVLLSYREFGTPSFDHALGLTVSKTNGDVTVAGYTGGSLFDPVWGTADGFVAQLTSALNPLWGNQFGTAAEDHVAGIVQGLSGLLYVGGLTYGAFPPFINEGGADGYVAVLNATNGDLLGGLQAGTGADEHVAGVAMAKSGDPIIAGATEGSLPGFTNAGQADGFVVDFTLT